MAITDTLRGQFTSGCKRWRLVCRVVFNIIVSISLYALSFTVRGLVWCSESLSQRTLQPYYLLLDYQISGVFSQYWHWFVRLTVLLFHIFWNCGCRVGSAPLISPERPKTAQNGRNPGGSHRAILPSVTRTRYDSTNHLNHAEAEHRPRRGPPRWRSSVLHSWEHPDTRRRRLVFCTALHGAALKFSGHWRQFDKSS